MTFRFYAQRPGSGLWLDNDAELFGCELKWNLSAPGSAHALIPTGSNNNLRASDGRPVWGRQDTIMYAEEDGHLTWAGICVGANPDQDGVHLEFAGTTSWLHKVPFDDNYMVWKTNAFDVARHIVNVAERHKPNVEHVVTQGDSQFTVGDTAPPEEPQPPVRGANQSTSDYQSTPEYDAYQKAHAEWNDLYGDRQQFAIHWYEAPYCGEELDSLAKECGFEYRERYKWKNRAKRQAEFHLDLNDHFARRKENIAFVEGINLAAKLDPKDADNPFANHVIGLGAGEGTSMVRVAVGGDDGRLYQAEYVQYKSIKVKDRLRSLAQADHKIYNAKAPVIDTVSVWDVPGYASIRTIRPGDEIEVVSRSIDPQIRAWYRVVGITRDTSQPFAVFSLENAE